jgi:hypothetical protein
MTGGFNRKAALEIDRVVSGWELVGIMLSELNVGDGGLDGCKKQVCVLENCY